MRTDHGLLRTDFSIVDFRLNVSQDESTNKTFTLKQGSSNDTILCSKRKRIRTKVDIFVIHLSFDVGRLDSTNPYVFSVYVPEFVDGHWSRVVFTILCVDTEITVSKTD